MTFSEPARKSAGLARSIRTHLGEAAYLLYKRTGSYNVAALEAAKLSKITFDPGLKRTLPLTVKKAREEAEQALTQADLRPDTPPVHGKDPGEFVRGLAVGDVIRDKRDRRIRVQKRYDEGLRLRILAGGGVEDHLWPELESMGLRPLEAPTSNQAARSLAELREEAKQHGVELTGKETTKEIEIKIGEVKARTGNELAQIDPQLAADDAKKNLDFDADQPWRSPNMYAEYWDNPDWVAEEKLDGVRLKLHFTPQGVRTDSRRRDTKTRRFSEKSVFPHLLALNIPELHGTVLDAEGMIPVEQGVSPVSGKPFYGSLAISTAATNAGPESSALIQDKFGPMQFWIFDALEVKGKDITNEPAAVRRKKMLDLVTEIHDKHPETKAWLHATKQAEGEDKLHFYESLIAKGGEGIIFKKMSASYEKGKRSKTWQKLKRFQEIDAYVSGYIPGEKGNEGLVGALKVSVNIDGSMEHWVAAVSQFTEEERLAMTAPDGSLKPEYYGKVLTLRGQQLAKNGRFRHAVFVSWRDDKTKDDIDGYEVRDELIELGLIEEKKPDAQERVF